MRQQDTLWTGVTGKSVVSGAILAVLMCAANSYLTLKAGVIEEGPIISALIFAGIFFALRRTVTVTEAMIAATMGSAGGSFGFIANMFAAFQMVGIKLTVIQMVLFSLSTGTLSLLFAIPCYYLFVVKEPLPWAVGQACADVIKSTVEAKSTIHAKVVLVFTLVFFGLMLCQGKGLLPADTTFFKIGLVSVGLAWSPFFLGAAGILGMRVGFGFLVGAGLLVLIAPYTDQPATPHRFFWPGVAFLITSGLTSMVLNWRSTFAAIASLRNLGKDAPGEPPIIPFSWLIGLGSGVMVLIVAVLWKWFAVGIHIGIIYVLGGALFLNLIATRAAAETTFNPVRAMGIVLQGVGALAGGVDKLVSLSGAGMMAGGTSQTSILCQDLYSGRKLGVNPRTQVVLQALVLPVIAIVSVAVYQIMSIFVHISITNDALPAPVAKAWAGFSILLAERKFPEQAASLMVMFGLLGIVVAVAERTEKIKRYVPSATGIGIALIMQVAYSLDFFVGAALFYLLQRKFRLSDETVSSVAAAGILGEAAGGMLNGFLQSLGIFPLS